MLNILYLSSASTLPPTTETTLVTSTSQSTTQEPTSTTDNDLDSTTGKWYIIETCSP
jgi:lipocalin